MSVSFLNLFKLEIIHDAAVADFLDRCSLVIGMLTFLSFLLIQVGSEDVVISCCQTSLLLAACFLFQLSSKSPILVEVCFLNLLKVKVLDREAFIGARLHKHIIFIPCKLEQFLETNNSLFVLLIFLKQFA